MPFGKVFAGLWLDKGILNAPADIAVLMSAPEVLWIVRDGGAGMAVPDIAIVDPFITDIAALTRVQYDRARLNVFAHVEDFLFLWVVDFEDDMGMVQGHAIGNAAGFN